jgi:hypothetical protein
MVARFRTLLAAILRACPCAILALVGSVPRPVEARRGRSAGFDAVTRLRKTAKTGGRQRAAQRLILAMVLSIVSLLPAGHSDLRTIAT